MISRRITMKRVRSQLTGWSVVCALLATPFVPSASTTWAVVVTALDNPRGLAFGPEGALYIAEAGRGGDGPCAPGPEGPRCFGLSGAVTRFDPARGSVERVASHLPSLGGQGTGHFATGIHDLSFQGRGNMFFTIGFGGDPLVRTTQFGEAGRLFARLARMTPNGKWAFEQDLGALEAERNPTGDEIDSNPYGVLALPGRQIIADAGANAVLEVRQNGRVRTLATLPNRTVPFGPGTISMDQVPTSVAIGPDGAIYLGQLTGFPFPVGGARVYRIPAEGGTPEVFLTGFTHIIDLAFGHDGSLYVLEIAKNGLLAAFGGGDWTGALIRVRPDGTRTELVPGALFAPGGVAVGRDGALYVTNNSIFSGTGEVIRIQE
jgi:hypothetical protein